MFQVISISKFLKRRLQSHLTMASSNQVPNVVDASASGPILEGFGTEIMICPQIRKSHCNFYLWDKSTSKHVERPCPFSFVSERAYQRHVFEMHTSDYEWMKRWYATEKKCRPLAGRAEVSGRLPRYPPLEEGPRIIDRKVREDPNKMIRMLGALYESNGEKTDTAGR